MEKKSTAVVKKEEQALALMQQEMAADAGQGFEEADKDAYAIPFLAILQANSPQCKKSEGAYIKGAEEGNLFNTVTSEIFDGEEGLGFVPVHFERRFVEWAPKDSGGGFKGEYSVAEGQDLLNTTHKNEKGKDVLPNGNELVDTRYHYGLVISNDGVTPALITMTSTQLKKSRRWMSIMQGIKIDTPNGQVTAPMFANTYLLTTTPESNDHGSWMGWKIERGQPVTDMGLYQAAKAFREAIRKGNAKPAAPVDEAAPTERRDDVDF